MERRASVSYTLDCVSFVLCSMFEYTKRHKAKENVTKLAEC